MEKWRTGRAVTFFFFSEASLLTLSQSCRTCRSPADRRFVWPVGAGRGHPGSRGEGLGGGRAGGERMLRTLKS